MLAGLAQQLLPLAARQAAAVPVGAGPFAAVVEEALVVVLGLQRRDLVGDERVERRQIGRQFRRQVEVHDRVSLEASRSLRSSMRLATICRQP
jgi:hypothetical protein